MKQFITYIIMLLIALMLHNSTATATNSEQLPVEPNDETCCVLSESPSTTQQAIQHFYRHLTLLTLCLDHSDHKRVPSVKCILLWAKYLLAEGGSDSPEWHHTHSTDIHPCNNPQDYYIFQLRKILI